MADNGFTVSGAVEFPTGPAIHVGAINVRVIDASRHDAPAPVLAEVTLPAQTVPGGAAIRFSITLPAGTDLSGKLVRAHARATDGERPGVIAVGDLISTTATPVTQQPMRLLLEPVT